MQLLLSFLCLFAIIIANAPSFSRGSVAISGVHDDVFSSENDFVPSSGINNIEESLGYHGIVEFFDQQKKIIVHKNEATGECVLELIDNPTNIFNDSDNKYDTNSELSEDDMIEIVGEKITAFCKGKAIILNNFDNTDWYRRSKRSTDNKKRYHGQTQTQFVSFGSKNSNQETKNGLAEAFSQPDLSRATVSGINGMGQAQSQSSFGDCDECSGQDYQPHSSHGDNSFSGNFPLSPPQSSIPQNKFSKPYGGSDMNRQSPDSQYRGNIEGPSINGQFSDSGMNGKGPIKQDQGYGTGSTIDGHYPNTYNKVPGTPDQVYGTGSSFGGKYPTEYSNSGTNSRNPGNQNQGYGSGPSVDGQYPGTFNRIPSKTDQGFGTGLPVNGRSSGTYNVPPSKENQSYGSGHTVDGHTDTNNKVPGIQDQGYGIGPVNGQYPGTYNRVPVKPNQGYSPGLSVDGQYPGTRPDSGSINKVPIKQDQGVQNSLNNHKHEPTPNLGNTDLVNHNTYPLGSSPFNSNPWNYPSIVNNNPRNHPSYPDGSISPIFPSGSSQGISGPQNTPNHNIKWTYPSNSPQFSLPNPQDVPIKPMTDSLNSQNIQQIEKGTVGMPSIPQNHQNAYNSVPWNMQGGQGLTQLNLPSLCNFLYQTCLNALSNNKRPNEFQLSGLSVPTIQQSAYPLNSGNLNSNQQSYGQPHGSLDAGISGTQQSGYSPSNKEQSQGSGGSGSQQPSYIPTIGSLYPNQIQPNYGQPSVQQPGYTPHGDNVNQNKPSYGQPQSTFGSEIPGTRQPGTSLINENHNQDQPSFIQPQGTFGQGGSSALQPDYTSSTGNVNLNQIRPINGQSQVGAEGSSNHQPGYAPSSGNIYPNQILPNYGQPQGSFNTGGSVTTKPGYVFPEGILNPNQIQPGYGKPQTTHGQEGFGGHQPSYAQSIGNINPNHVQPGYGQPQTTHGQEGFGGQQPSYGPSSATGYPNSPTSAAGYPNSPTSAAGYPNSPSNAAGYPNSPSSAAGYPNSPSSAAGYPNSPTSGAGYPNSPTSGAGYLNSPTSAAGYPNSPTSGAGYPNSPTSAAGYPNIPSSAASYPNSPVPGNYHQAYGGNDYKGQPLVPGNQVGNNYPIVGGQFGTDISSGGSVMPIDTEGGDSQSMTNVNVDGQETSASASSQGKSKFGMTQTQVSGTYSGTGTFSAQAQTSDSDKGAQSQIVSNTNGTTSTAQGRGGKGQAQSQVIYNSESGIALGESQSSGVNYGTNTQLQAGIKGGLADAQSTGPGSTSSQAQIGFLPYESNNSTDQKSLFRGGGTASSQSGQYNGQSQSQLFGSYKHGISYNGAAQASSGKKLQNLPKLNLADAKLKIGQLEGSNNVAKRTELQPQQSIPNVLKSQTAIKENISGYNEQLSNIKPNISSTQTSPSVLPQLSRNFEIDTEYDDSEEYEDDKEETINTKSGQITKETNPKQEQNIILNLGDKHDAQITRDSDSQLKAGQILDAGQIIPGTNGTVIPNGYRGRVASIAGDHTEAKATPGGQAQTQTVLLTPGAGGLTVVDKAKFKALLSKESYINPENKQYNGFLTDINGQTGKFNHDNKSVQYFTKSSICGYFSFSCNYVNGKNGPKICKPNPSPIPCQKSN